MVMQKKLVLTGTSDNIKMALEYFEAKFSDPDRQTTIPCQEPFIDGIIKELQEKVGMKHKVDLSQQWDGELIIKGLNCMEASKELAQICKLIEKYNMPKDWINPVQQIIQDDQICVHQLDS